MVKAIKNRSSMLRVIRPFTSQNQLAMIANATLNSLIQYVAPLWSQTGTVNLQRIQTAQTRAARQITWHRRTSKEELEHRQTLFESIGWLNVTQIANQSTLQIVSKALNKRTSKGINQMFTWKEAGSRREAGSHQATTENTNKRKGPTLLDKGRELFNKLPLNLCNNSLKP